MSCGASLWFAFMYDWGQITPSSGQYANKLQKGQNVAVQY
ncbi:hypothetical protein A11S_1961 [Micavibrio aeruginosavorus EPB]|uniref:Uncharacterized protein n=1 Tax=Micavibrio aeruginosavorus EPB TaxID=349215 RepID=M4VH97_9BACT|nr:hypothetical protein A11S_1961 [Micavibrio aeruginosavorus EPB]